MNNQTSFNGFYRGIVTDNEDPLQAGRVRVRVLPMFDGVVDTHLPWAILSDPFMGGLSGIGGTFIPENGTHVFVFFENGDHRFPVYFGGAPAMQNETPDLPVESRENGGEYPSNKVFKTKNGILVELDDTKDSERVHIKHPTGTEILINKDGYYVTSKGACEFQVDGDTTINSTGDITVTTEGDMTATVQGTATIEAQNDVVVTASNNVTLEGATNVEITGGSQVTVTSALITLN